MKKQIVVIRSDVLGDVVLSCPLLHKIKSLFPNSALTVVAQASVIPLLEQHRSVDHIQLDFKKNEIRSRKRNFIAAVSFFKTIKADMVFFPVMDEFYVWAAFIARVPIRVGDSRKVLLNPLLTHKVPIEWRDITKHEVEQQLRLLSPFSSDVAAQSFGIQLSGELSESYREKYRQFSDKRWVIVHPNYGNGNRGFKAEAYARLIESLLESEKLYVFLTGTEEDRHSTDAIYDYCLNKPINLTNKTALVELMFLVQNAACVIGAETGPLHLASCFKVPVVSISPTKFVQSFRWGPYHTNHVVIKNNKSCPLVCHTYKRPCIETYCIDSIKVSDIKQSVDFLLQGGVFPSSHIHYWFITNAKVAIHLDELLPDETNYIISQYQKFSQAGIGVFLTTTTRDVYRQFFDQGIDCVYQSKWKLFFWINWYSIQNVTVWHVVNTQRSKSWFSWIRRFVALQINLPPLVIFEKLHEGSIKEQLDRYIIFSKALSR